jgi:hypothetical protein
MPNELPIPPAALGNAQSVEMIRVWLAGGKQHCVLNIGFWENRGLNERHGWGILLADMVHHIANAHNEEHGRDRRETIKMVRESLLAELEHPTSDRLGNFVAQKQESRSRKSDAST